MRQKKIIGILFTVILVGASARAAPAQESSKKLLVAYGGLISAAELADSSFIDRLEKSGYVQEAMKRK